MATEVFSTGDARGHSALVPPIARRIHEIDMAAGVAQDVAWPTGYEFLMFSAPADFYIRVGGDAAVKAAESGNQVAGTGSARNPAARKRDGETAFSMISATAQIITLEFYKAAV